MADALDSKSSEGKPRVGSSPTSGTCSFLGFHGKRATWFPCVRSGQPGQRTNRGGDGHDQVADDFRSGMRAVDLRLRSCRADLELHARSSRCQSNATGRFPQDVTGSDRSLPGSQPGTPLRRNLATPVVAHRHGDAFQCRLPPPRKAGKSAIRLLLGHPTSNGPRTGDPRSTERQGHLDKADDRLATRTGSISLLHCHSRFGQTVDPCRINCSIDLKSCRCSVPLGPTPSTVHGH